MAFIRNEDGSFLVTDPDGNEVANQVPAEWVPSDVIAGLGASASAIPEDQAMGVGQAVAAPPADVPAEVPVEVPLEEPVVEAPVEESPPDDPTISDLYNQPGIQLPPSLFGMATAGGGDGVMSAREFAAQTGQKYDLPTTTNVPANANEGGGKLRYDAANDRFIPNKPAPKPVGETIGAATGAATAPGDPAAALTRRVLDEQIMGRRVYSAGSPEKWVPQSMSVERQAALSPETKDQQNLAYSLAIETARLNGARQSNEMANQAVEYERQRQSAQLELDDIKRKEAERDAVLWPKLAIIQRNSDNIRSFKVDPNLYWERKGVVGTVLANIGVALGAMGAAVTGGPNQVYQKVRAEIEDEIGAQRATLEAMKGAQESDLNTLAQMRQLFISPESAEVATRALLLETMAASTRKMAAEIGSQEALAKGEELAAKYSIEAANEAAKLEQLEGGAIKETQKFKPAVAAGWTHFGPKNATETYKIFVSMAGTQDRPVEDLIRFYATNSPGLGASPAERKLHNEALKLDYQMSQTAWRDPETGKTFYAPNEESANKFRRGVPGLTIMKRNLAEIAEIWDRNASGVLSGIGKDAARVRELVADNDSFAKDAIVGDAMQAHEEMRVAAQTGRTALDRTSFINRAEAFKAAQESLSRRIEIARSQSRESPIFGGYAAETPKATRYTVPKGAVKVEPKAK